jgi:hypothetical protein
VPDGFGVLPVFLMLAFLASVTILPILRFGHLGGAIPDGGC